MVAMSGPDGGAPSEREGQVGREARERAATATPGGEVRRRLDRPPGERYRQPDESAPPPSRARRLGIALAAAVGIGLATFALVTVDLGPGLLVVGLTGGWLAGIAAAGGSPAGRGADAGTGRGALAALLAALAIALGLVLDSLRAYALGGVLLPWEYALARFGGVAPLSILLAAAVGWLRGR